MKGHLANSLLLPPSVECEDCSYAMYVQEFGCRVHLTDSMPLFKPVQEILIRQNRPLLVPLDVPFLWPHEDDEVPPEGLYKIWDFSGLLRHGVTYESGRDFQQGVTDVLMPFLAREFIWCLSHR